ncbi:MAG TPA: hypothetical protein PKM73_03320 [Verrucomicrobiota bacterium]|nr:hypothetical protein [Verrucomicrobiota bacterium]HNU50387.1 hypothetical protein [Verrucomicrobiota bacterium]
MKNCHRHSTLLGLGLGVALLASPGHGGVPQPLCVFYGQARDGFGLPYRENANVILRHGTNEVARQTIRGSLAPGVNFALYVHLDDGRGTKPYSNRALRTGDRVSIVVSDGEGEKTILESATVPPVGQPGDLMLLNVTAARDDDGDGLPDLWEWELIAWSDGALGGLWDVDGGDDFDGDGMSNLEEYRAGTFAFLDYDALLVEELIPAGGGRLRLTFLSVPGKTYSVRCAADLNGSDWQACAFSLSDTGPLQTTPAEGDGGWFSVYTPIGEPTRFYRLVAE